MDREWHRSSRESGDTTSAGRRTDAAAPRERTTRPPLPPLLTTIARTSAIERIRARLMRRGAPRLQMSLIVLLTGLTGFVSSFLLLHAGVTRMVLRYPLAVAGAYAVFLACLWVWLRRHRLHARRREEARTSVSDPLDFDVTNVQFTFGGDATPDAMPFEGFGGGGGFSGGGGGSSWGSGASSAKSGGGVDLGLDLDEGAVVIIPLLVAAALATGVALYVVYIAPVLFAELLLDTALSAGLYRRLNQGDRSNWLRCALRRTVVPAILVMLLLGGAGWWMQVVYPQATSIGRVWERVQEGSRKGG
jgi:hypothetical protein